MNGVERSNDGVVLKKCPFCGGEARMEAEAIGKEKYLYSVSCINDCVTQGIYHKTVDSAIKAWNTRKPVENVLERLEEQAEECKKYWDEFDDEYAFGGMNAYMNSIAIIKEGMG